MVEQIRPWYRDDPFVALVLVGVGVVCLVLVLNRLVGPIRLGIEQRVGQWLGQNVVLIPLGIGVLCLLGAVALLANPVRLLMHGKNADGVVTRIIETTSLDEKGRTVIRSTAIILFKAGDRDRTIERSTSRSMGSTCFAGCYSKGERLAMVYLEDDPEVVEVNSFVGFFGGPLTLGLVGGFAIFLWRLWRSERPTVPLPPA